MASDKPGAGEQKQSKLSNAVMSSWERNRIRLYIFGLLVILFVAFFWPRMFITVEAGHRGVMFRRFAGGTVTDRVWGEGFHVVPPWDVLEVYETRIQQTSFTFPTLTRDGLRIQLLITVRYRPRISKVGLLHETVGPDYYERIIKPEIKSALRRTVGDRTAFEIYSTEGDVLQQALKDAIRDIERKPIDLDDLLIEEITLPPIVKEAIDHKHKQEQELLEYEFRLQRAEKEAERKRTEATGIRDYDAIISQQGISEQVLRWRGIDATLELARSNNAKMIVIGGGTSGLPLILDATGKTLDAAKPGPKQPDAPAQQEGDMDSQLDDAAAAAAAAN